MNVSNNPPDPLSQPDPSPPPDIGGTNENDGSNAATSEPSVHLGKVQDSDESGVTEADAEEIVPFPVDALPGGYGRYVQACADCVDCDPAMVGLPLLCSLAVAIGNSARIRVKHGFEQPSVLWGMVLADSGTAKSPAADHGLRPLREVNAKLMREHQQALLLHCVDKARYDEALEDWEAERKGPPPEEPAAPISRMLVVNNATVEGIVDHLAIAPRSLLMDADELSGFLGSLDRYSKGKGADASSFMTFYDARDLTVIRKGNGTVTVPRANVSIFGTIQPGVLDRYLDTSHDEMGFAARFLVAYPERRAMVFNMREVPPDLLLEVTRGIEMLVNDSGLGGDPGSIEPRILALSKDAIEIYGALQDRLSTDSLREGGSLGRHLTKLAPATLRFALVIHCCRRSLGEPVTDEVDVKSMQAAVRFEQYFEWSIRRVCEYRELEASERQSRLEVEWICLSPEGVTAAELHRRFRKRFQSSEFAENFLERLVAGGMGCWSESRYPKGGRPTRRFVMHSPAPIPLQSPRLVI